MDDQTAVYSDQNEIIYQEKCSWGDWDMDDEVSVTLVKLGGFHNPFADYVYHGFHGAFYLSIVRVCVENEVVTNAEGFGVSAEPHIFTFKDYRNDAQAIRAHVLLFEDLRHQWLQANRSEAWKNAGVEKYHGHLKRSGIR